jgi:hypothetical protein
MAKDPAFLFYSQDFYTGVATLDWEDRGKFISILCLMHQQGRMSEETIRFLVGSISVKLKSKFRIDENGLWYNARLELETEKRNSFTESRRLNGNLGGRPKKQKAKGKPKNNLKDNHTVNRMEDEIVNENENDNTVFKYNYESSDKELLRDYDNWTDDITNGNDQFFEQMFTREMIPAGDHIQFWILDHRDLLNRYPKMRPPTQDAFRKSCIKHIRENYKKPINGNGASKKSAEIIDRRTAFAKRHGTSPE